MSGDGLRQKRHLKIYRSLAEAQPIWRALTADHPCYVFQTFEWMSLWYQTIGQAEGVEPFIVCLNGRAGEPEMLLPLGIRRRYGCRILVFLGGDVTDYNAPLCGAQAHGVCTASLWRRIARMARVDLIWLQRMPERLADGANPLIAATPAGHVGNAYMAARLPETFADFVASNSRAYFADTRRKRRKLERLGAISLEVAQTPREATEIAEAMLRQKRRRIADSGARPMSRQHESFYRALVHTSFAHVACLRVAGELVATHIGVVHENRFYWLMPGYEAGEWARLSVGRILLQSLFEWCIGHGIQCFDLTIGDEEYKRFWSDSRMQMYESRYAMTLAGVCFNAGSRLNAAVHAGRGDERPDAGSPVPVPAARRTAAAGLPGGSSPTPRAHHTLPASS